MDKIETLQALLPRLATYGERPAVVLFSKDRTETWSYAKLADHAERLAAGLTRESIGKDACVGLFAENSPQWFVACLGVLAAGATAVPLDNQLSEEALHHELRDSGVSLIFTTERLLKRVRQALGRRKCEVLLLGESANGAGGWKDLLVEQEGPAVTVSPDDRAVLFYTSGTTGLPKGVPLTHRNLAFQLNTLATAGIVTNKDRVLLPLPLHHVYPFTIGVLTPLALGLPIILPYNLTGPQLVRALREGQVTTIIGVPRLYRALASAIESKAKSAGRAAFAMFRGALALSTLLAKNRIRSGRLLFRRIHREMGPRLRDLATGGAAMEPGLAWKLEAIGWQVSTGYGLTETSPLLTMDKPGEARIGSVGRPIEGVEIRIDPVATDGTPSEPASEGEVVARGPGVFAGYHNLPDKTKEAFTDDGWFRTGDLGYLEDGYLFITGRVKTLIVLEGGEKVQPDDIEEKYQRHPALREVGVLERDGKVVAVIRPGQGAGAGEDQQAAAATIRSAVQESSRSLASYQRIADFVVAQEALPRTQLGKIRREELKKAYDELKSGHAQPARAGPISEDEMSPDDRALLDEATAKKTWQWLAEHFADHPLAPDSNLQLDLGIDSLQWLNLTMEIRQRAGVELSEESIGRIETVRDLLREVADQPQGTAAVPSVDPLEKPDELLGPEGQWWVATPGPVEQAASRCLFALDWMLVHAAFRVSVSGLWRLPVKGPFVLTPNHVSYLDSFVLSAVLGYGVLSQTYWAGWSGVAFGPVFRILRRLCHVVPIDPDRAAATSLAYGAAVLARKHNMVWYPEGGHSKTGELGPLKLGTGLLLHRYPVPVVPVHIEGTRDSLPPGRWVPRPGRHIQIIFGNPLDPRELEKQGQGKTPHERLTSALREEMLRLRPIHALGRTTGRVASNSSQPVA